MLVRGFILLLVLTIALFAAVRTVMRSGESPASCDTSSQACVETTQVHRGG